MFRDNFFTDRIDRMYNRKEIIGSLSKHDLFQKIRQFKLENKGYFTSIDNNMDIKSHVDELDFLICFLFDYYNELIKVQKGDYVKLGIILLIKSYIQDVIAIRNLVDMNLEIQVCNQARTLMERELVIALCISDEDYCQDLIINNKSKTDKQRFYTLTRPKSLLDKLKTNKPLIFNLFYSDTWENTYSLFSLFCHNDIYEWIRYFNEGNKYSISLQNSQSKYFTYRLSYISQNIIVFSMALIACYNVTETKYTLDIHSIFIEYWQAIIEDSYKERP